MTRYFIVANSFAAPFFSDRIEKYIEADSPESEITAFLDTKPHPCGIYCALAYTSADAYHLGEDSAARWLSNRAAFIDSFTKKGGCSALYSKDINHVEIDHKEYTIDNPRGGSFTGKD